MTNPRPPKRRLPRPRPDDLTQALHALTETRTNPEDKAGPKLPPRIAGLAHTVNVLTNVADGGYPTTASGADTSTPANEVDENGQPVPRPTRVERLVLNPDLAMARAIEELEFLATLPTILHRAGRIIDGTAAMRAIKRCPSCTAPWDEERWGNTCRAQIPNVGACGHVIGIDLDADICAAPGCSKALKVGDRVKSEADGKERCKTCASYFRRYGVEKGSRSGSNTHAWHSVDDYHDTTGMISTEEVDA